VESDVGERDVASWFALREYAQVCKEQYGVGLCDLGA